MTEPALLLGPISFRDFEIPASISFGGRQRSTVRYLTTGQRIVDLLGPDDATISFAGILSGSNAGVRAREIDALRISGEPLDLTWNTFLYSVVIKNYETEFLSPTWIIYRIDCLVLTNPVAVAVGAGLSAAGNALTSLSAMYDSVPNSLLAIPDTRRALATHTASITPLQISDIVNELRDSRAILSEEQRRRESDLTPVALNNGHSVEQFTRIFASMAAAAETVHLLSVAQDCLGQATVYLTQAPGS